MNSRVSTVFILFRVLTIKCPLINNIQHKIIIYSFIIIIIIYYYYPYYTYYHSYSYYFYYSYYYNYIAIIFVRIYLLYL
jgi:hypothetical protein